MFFGSRIERHWLGSQMVLQCAGFEAIVTVSFEEAR
jgi:hypothetical protein